MAQADPEPEQEDRPRRHGSLISTRPLPLPPHRARSRNPFRWLWYIWRYGWAHPDEDLLGVIDAAGDSLRAQIASARGVVEPAQLPRLDEIEQRLEDELRERVPELAILLGLEAQINSLYPPAVQRRRAWMIRERFERVAPGHAAVAYWASNPPDPALGLYHDERLRQGEARLAAAVQAQESSAAALEQARAGADALRAEYDAAHAALAEQHPDLDARLDALADLRAGDPEGEATRAADETFGALLDQRAESQAAEAAVAAAEQAHAAAEQARVRAEAERDLARSRQALHGKETELSDARESARLAGDTSAWRSRIQALTAERDRARAELEAQEGRVEALAEAGGGAQSSNQGSGENGGAGGGENGGNGDGGGNGAGNGGNPPPPQPPRSSAASADSAGSVAADAQTLLGYIHTSYLMTVGREKAVRDLMRWLMMRFWSANAVVLVVILLIAFIFSSSRLNNLGNLVFGLFLVAAVGRIGATMSVVQRLQVAVSGNILSRDSMLELTRLRTGKNGINLALFSGAVFALLMYAMFASGAPAMIGFDDGLFPRLERPPLTEGELREQSRADAEAVARLTRQVEEQEGRVAAARTAEAGEETAAPEAAAGEGAGEETAPAETAAETGEASTETPRFTPPLGTLASEEYRLLQLQGALEFALRRLQRDRLRAPPGETSETPVADAQAGSKEPAGTEGSGSEAGAAAGNEAAAADENAAGADANAAAVADRQAGEAPAQPEAVAGNEVAAAEPDKTAEEEEEGPGLVGWLQARWQAMLGESGNGGQCKATDTCDPFSQFADALGFADRSDFFKLLIWAFLAGFAERLVPDVLDSITRRTRATVEIQEQRSIARFRGMAGETRQTTTGVHTVSDTS